VIPGRTVQKRPLVQNLKQSHLPEIFGVNLMVPVRPVVRHVMIIVLKVAGALSDAMPF